MSHENKDEDASMLQHIMTMNNLQQRNEEARKRAKEI